MKSVSSGKTGTVKPTFKHVKAIKPTFRHVKAIWMATGANNPASDLGCTIVQPAKGIVTSCRSAKMERNPVARSR